MSNYYSIKLGVDQEQANAMYNRLGYQVDQFVGSGGFKQVFLAHYEGRPVALKVLDLDQGAYRANLEFRAQREAQSMASIDSPYVAKIIDFNLGGLQHRAYIAEEFISGISLLERMTQGLPTNTEAIQWMDDIFHALMACASRTIVHRDVKPGNILLRENGQAVLTDFGLARLIDDSTITASGILIGTLMYAPPELIQFNSDLLDETIDLFSFGILCYEMFSGEHPFITDTVSSRDEALKKMLYETAIPLSQKNAGVSEDLSRLVMTLIRRERSDRYPSVERAYNKFKQIRNMV
jgi:eukaryotic-like serine/threonine-protein kinase